MQKWEYMVVIRDRTWEKDPTAGPSSGRYVGTAWNIWTWTKGAKEGKRWEGGTLTNLLCELGDQGWELVEGHPRSDYISEIFAGFTSSENYILKRPKPD